MNENRKLSRRSMLLLAGGTLAAGVAGMKPAYAQKSPKADMKYQDTPKDGQKCDECQYWQKPGSCALVEGPISPNGWCIIYNKKK